MIILDPGREEFLFYCGRQMGVMRRFSVVSSGSWFSQLFYRLFFGGNQRGINCEKEEIKL